MVQIRKHFFPNQFCATKAEYKQVTVKILSIFLKKIGLFFEKNGLFFVKIQIFMRAFVLSQFYQGIRIF